MQKHLNFTKYLKKHHQEKKIRIGTDCSGIEAPIQALNILGVPYEHVFSCENDVYAQQNIQHNYDPQYFYCDITTRNHNKLPNIDLYVCGFPCQSFSMLGKRAGFEDEIKGTIFFECLETIRSTRPTAFVLENVKGLINHDSGHTFEIIMKHLQSLKYYNIYHQILNTLDYGIPQNRERIYIVGIQKNRDNGFQFPSPIPLKIYVTDILDRKIDSKIDSEIDSEICDDYYWNLTRHKMDILSDLYNSGKIDNFNKPWLVNLNVSDAKRTTPMLNLCPTLLAGNGGDCIYYLTSHQRRLTPSEYLKLQGFPTEFESVVQRGKTYKQAGNTMSVNVLCFLFTNIFRQVSF